MSLVMAIGNKDFILFASEKRKTTTNILTKEITIDENCEKIFKINKNVLLGYAGDLDYCKIVTESLLNNKMNLRENHNLTYKQVDNFIGARFKNIIKQVEADPIKYRKSRAYIVVGGVEGGVLNLSSYFYEDELKINKFILKCATPKLITLSSGQYDHEEYFRGIFSAKPMVKIDNMKKIFNKTVMNGIKFDTSLNNNVDFKEIVLKES